jgi:histidinol-phosphatase
VTAVAPVDPGLLDEAVDLARRAGDLTLRWFRRPDLAVERKHDGTPVTEADRSAESLVRQHLAEHHAADTVVGEEDTNVDGTSGRRWVVDPIDGTKAFTHGVPLYSTLLALDDEHGPAIGVIHLPALGETVWAGRGLGCFVNGTPARVSDHASLDGAYVMTSAVDHWPPGALDHLHDAGAVVRTWGDGYGYALVATGRAEAMVDPTVAVWDIAAMPVLLAEAGGRFTDLSGRTSTDGGSGVASNGLIHEPLLAPLQPRGN